MSTKKVITSVASVAVVGILSYFSYRVFKEIDNLAVDDLVWENMDDVYHYRTPQSDSSSQSYVGCQQPTVQRVLEESNRPIA